MKTITRNIDSTIIVVIICLIIYTISMVVNPLRINNRLYNGLDSKTVYALSFVNLLGYPENIFKSPLTIEDYEVPIEGDTNTVNDNSAGKVSDGLYTGTIANMRALINKLSNEELGLISSYKNNFVDVAPIVYNRIMSDIKGVHKDWEDKTAIISGMLRNYLNESALVPITSIKFDGRTYEEIFNDIESTPNNKGIGLKQFIASNAHKAMAKKFRNELKNYGKSLSDIAERDVLINLELDFIIPSLEGWKNSWKSAWSYWGESKRPEGFKISEYVDYAITGKKGRTDVKEYVTPLKDKRKLFDLSRMSFPNDVHTAEKCAFYYMVCEERLTAWKPNYNLRIESAKDIYNIFNKIEKMSVGGTTKQNGTQNIYNVTSTNSGDYLWIGDSRTMQIIVQNQSEFNEHNANKFIDKNMKLVYGIRTVVDEKSNQQHKLIMHGVGSGAFVHMNGKNDEYDKDFRKGINDALDKLSNGNIILWFGINQGLSGVSTETIRDGNRYVSLPGPLKDNSWLKNLIDSLDSKNNKLFLVQVYPNYENNGLPYDYTTDNGVTKNYTHLLVNKMFKQLVSDKPSRISYVQLWDGVGLSPYSVDNTNTPNDKLHLKPDFGRKILNEVIGRLGLRFK